jgi:hypothetical protein
MKVFSKNKLEGTHFDTPFGSDPRYPIANMRVIWVSAVLTGILRAAAPRTFYKDVLPVLDQHRQNWAEMTDGVAMGAQPTRRRSE